MPRVFRQQYTRPIPEGAERTTVKDNAARRLRRKIAGRMRKKARLALARRDHNSPHSSRNLRESRFPAGVFGWECGPSAEIDWANELS
jgi:hypothetical protein